MDTFFIILGIICLSVQIPVWTVYFLHKREIDEKAAEAMKKREINRPKAIQPPKRYTGIPWMPYV